MEKVKKEAKKDCFAYDKKTHNCKALNECFCKVEDCKFYKTKEQFLEEQKKYKKLLF